MFILLRENTQDYRIESIEKKNKKLLLVSEFMARDICIYE